MSTPVHRTRITARRDETAPTVVDHGSAGHPQTAPTVADHGSGQTAPTVVDRRAATHEQDTLAHAPLAHGDRLVLERYRLLRRLGSGGHGAVWLARDERLGRAVAVKLIPRDERTSGRARREAAASARLNHPGIVTLYEAGEDDQAAYLVSELVDGRTLAAALAAGELSDAAIARIGVLLCDALSHAHCHGVVHRDVKPQNVIVPSAPAAGAGIAKLTDFGVAAVADDEALTRTGDIIGTYAYMAPEQADGRRAGREADLYSLALVLYEALAGIHPQNGVRGWRSGRAPCPPLRRARRDLPGDLCRAIDRALALEPQRRGTLADLRAALSAAAPRLGQIRGTVSPARFERSIAARQAEAGLPDFELSSDVASGLEPGAPDFGLVPDGPGLSPGTGVPGGVAPESPGSRVDRLSRAAIPRRAVAAAGTALLVGLATLLPGPHPPVGAGALVLVAAAAVALLPRLGWLAAAFAALGWLAASSPSRGGLALVLAAALLTCPLLRPRGGWTWSLPTLAPLLGLAGLSGAFPVLAGSLRGPWSRAALGALGYWWLAIAETLLGRTLWLGPPPATPALGRWQGAPTTAIAHVLAPLASSGLLIGAAIWAVAAVLWPLAIRSRARALVLIGALTWALACWLASDALGGALHGAGLAAGARGALLGPLVGALVGVLAVSVRPVAPAAAVA